MGKKEDVKICTMQTEDKGPSEGMWDAISRMRACV